MEGRKLLQQLLRSGISSSYCLLNALPYVMQVLAQLPGALCECLSGRPVFSVKLDDAGLMSRSMVLSALCSTTPRGKYLQTECSVS